MTAILVNVAAITALLTAVPSFVSRLTTPEGIGVAGYVLSFALLETILLSIPIALVGLALIFVNRHIHLAIYLAGGLLALTLLLMPCDPQGLFGATCGPHRWLLAVILVLSWIGWVSIAVRRFPGWIRRIYAGLERVQILAVLYLAFDLFAVVVVVGRLIQPAVSG